MMGLSAPDIMAATVPKTRRATSAKVVVLMASSQSPPSFFWPCLPVFSSAWLASWLIFSYNAAQLLSLASDFIEHYPFLSVSP